MSTLVQFIVDFFKITQNEQQRNLTDLKIIRTV